MLATSKSTVGLPRPLRRIQDQRDRRGRGFHSGLKMSNATVGPGSFGNGGFHGGANSTEVEAFTVADLAALGLRGHTI